MPYVARLGGLSPRVRGNPRGASRMPKMPGSIPACTGEPRRRPMPYLPRGVYPRVYGGTSQAPRAGRPMGGLSPRVRGNPQPAQPAQPRLGSIPACTGEPASSRIGSPARAVYPRVYGGTGDAIPRATCERGLSPRVRGNPVHHVDRVRRQRSIPACTGEPWANTSSRPSSRVYPRVYGGTHAQRIPDPHPGGLSPRVRGNLGVQLDLPAVQRSIPACTGEPASGSGSPRSRAVYPRVYGGT